MRLKAVLSNSGLRLLEKGFLPTLEKFSKSSTLLVSPDEVLFIQKAVDADGMHVSLRVPQELLFRELMCVSRHRNWVGFSVDVAQLLRVLRAAGANVPEELELKLNQLSSRGQTTATDTAPAASKPFLTVSAKGQVLDIQQDIPISTPLRPSEIDDIIADIEAAESDLCSWYLDLKPELPRLQEIHEQRSKDAMQAIVDKMKTMSTELDISVTAAGDLHLQVASSGMRLGTELRGLQADPTAQADPLSKPRCRAHTAEGRLAEAHDTGQAARVCVHSKHFQRGIHSSLVADLARVLCGIDKDLGFLQLLVVLEQGEEPDSYAVDKHITIKLPVRDL